MSIPAWILARLSFSAAHCVHDRPVTAAALVIAAFVAGGGIVCLAAQVPGKTNVLTGAMVPYAFGSSDGLFNLGSALSFAQALPAGVYVAMNGTAFPWNQVRKNRASGHFEVTVDPVDAAKRGHEEATETQRH